MLTSIDGLIWLLLALVVLLFVQRILHREIQAIFLISTRSPGVTMGAFSLIFFPGVFLHERLRAIQFLGAALVLLAALLASRDRPQASEAAAERG